VVLSPEKIYCEEVAMKQLPESEIYKDGLAYWPYKDSLQAVLDHVITHTPQNGSLLDIMCGPGYLLGKIAEKRSDLVLYGVDIDARYVSHGNRTYERAVFERGDVLSWRPTAPFDVVVCSGAVHHVPYEQQERAIANIASIVKPGGFAIISDCYVDDYANEMERRLAAAKLGYEYLKVTIENGAPSTVLGWTVDILYNDVLMDEYKMSLEKRMAILRKHFRSISTLKAWPKSEQNFQSPSGYGDYIHVCVN
jgi:SAM-dependent methyltransferase